MATHILFLGCAHIPRVGLEGWLNAREKPEAYISLPLLLELSSGFPHITVAGCHRLFSYPTGANVDEL